MLTLSFITVLCAACSVYWSSQSAKYASRTVKWYENPSPLLVVWSSAEEEIKENGAYSIPIISDYSPKTGIKKLTYIEKERKIDFWVHNAGRITATRIWVYLIMNTKGFPFS